MTQKAEGGVRARLQRDEKLFRRVILTALVPDEEEVLPLQELRQALSAKTSSIRPPRSCRFEFALKPIYASERDNGAFAVMPPKS